MRLISSLLAIVAAAATLTAQSDATTAASITRLIEQELAAARVPGAAIVVRHRGHTVATGYGVADVDSGTPVTAATLVHVGSLTKVFTALAVTATLEDRGIPRDAPVGRFLGGLHPRVASATFHQLLSQTSGLGDRPGDDGTQDEAALLQAARALSDASFVLPPGVVFSYSNHGYALAGAALEAIAGRPFADAFAGAVLRPLAMSQSTVRLPEALAKPHAVGHRLDAAKIIAVRPPANDTRITPAGYLWTTATDMSRALDALMDPARRQGLKSAVVNQVISPHTPMPNVFVGGHYGYGMMLLRDRGVDVYEHGGTLPGFSSILRVAPGRDVGVAILANLDNVPLRRIAQVAMTRALGLPDVVPVMRQETGVTVDEMTPLLGVYRNRGTAELAVRDGGVVLMLDGGPPLLVSRIGENRYLARPKPAIAGPEFVLQPASNGVPAYLHFALWAYTR